jgi:hypothetical protein
VHVFRLIKLTDAELQSLTYIIYIYAELQLTDAQIDNLTLIEIEKLLEANRRSLADYPCIPFPNHYVTAKLGNRLIYDELNYDTQQQKEEFQQLFKSLTGISQLFFQ